MAYQDLNTLKNWFKRGLKPLQQQFWDWLDSFYHKGEDIPSSKIDGLQELLDAKLDKKDAIPPEQVGEYNPTKNYVYDAALAEYVSFSNAQSSDPQFQVEGFYRLTEDAPAGESPETHPEHWAYQGYTLGEITIDDVVGLYEELLRLSYSDGINLRDPSSESIDGIGTKVSQALVQLKTAILVIQDYLRNIGSAVAAFEADPVPQQVSETETRLTFTKAFESNNPDAIEVDDTFDTVTIKRAGKWQFISALNASNSSFFSAHNLWLTTRDQSDDEIITQRPINIPASGYSGSSSYIFDVQEADLPLTLEFYHQGDDALQIESLTTNIVSLESVGGGGIVDDELSETSENAVQNKVITNRTLSTIKPDANNAKKIPVVSDDGTIIGYTAFTYEEIVQLAAIDMSDINVGESKIVLAEKSADGTPIMGGAISQLDKLGPPTLEALLAETNPLWDGDEITITGDNQTGALGENSQEYRIGSDFFLCIAHSYGSAATNGSAIWVRNRGQDSLTPGVIHDDDIISELEVESGWSSADFKQIVNKSKKGTWYRAATGGYHYLCIDKNNGWSRVGLPSAIDIEISAASHPTLIANLSAHDFAINGMYLESSDVANETAEQAQEWWDQMNNSWYKRNMTGYWAKMN